MKTRMMILAGLVMASGQVGAAMDAAMARTATAPNGSASAVSSMRMVRPTTSPVIAASQADDSASLRVGLVNDVSASGDQVQVNGTWSKFVDGKSRVVQQGRQMSFAALKKGQKVRFTLLAAGGDQPTLGVIYVP